ncbi:MAG: aldolase [Acidimicrobiales bacterium]|nr:aldolase [Acidimicrobiales bacterium]
MTATENREVVAEDFTTANATSFAGNEWAARVDLAAMYRLAAHFGYDDLVWNHITMRVPGTDHAFFLNKFGLLYNEVTASNLIKVDADGTVLEGPADVNTAGFVIHSAIHNDFPKWKVVFHAHVPDALAVTALKNGFEHLVQDTSMLYGEIGYHDWEGLSLTLEERGRLAANMAGNRALIMRNHGFLTVGETAGEAFMVMHYLIRGCRTLLKAHGSGLAVDPGPKAIWELSKRQYDHFPLGKYEWPALMRMLDQTDPSYRQ